MDRYTERRPPAPTGELLTRVWARRVDTPPAGVARVVPDACADIIWHRATGALFVAGPDTAARLASTAPGEMVGARFRSGHAPAGLGVPADVLRDQQVPLDALWEAGRVARLAEGLHGTTSAAEAQDVLAASVLDGVRTGPDPAVPALLALAGAGRRVSAMAEEIGLTERQVHRRCLAAFGYGAKVLARVLRFQNALRLARQGTGLADVAHRCGYADQAHLSREVRALAGVPLTALVG
ncbi:helix-turn-helix domain-containing protein [Actinophytocola xinjiangensis]|uniref:helix-turn-helix domain-containing protein n=1 Tax=Actinophytocola xinjiangensis TaxID=485602 RepID=UPI0009FC1D03|nr:helix-turn-helix domain-containing protein [Actinophytocola xinjiangensis]